MTGAARRYYQFGPFRLDPQDRVLLKAGKVVSLHPKAVAVLLLLVENSDRVVTRDEFLEKIWAGTYVGEGSLYVIISLLRNVLGRDGSGNPYIVTVPKRGYRFAAPVEAAEDRPAARPLIKRSLAALPFKLFGTDADERYLGLGIADTLITRLGANRNVVVRPTAAVQKYEGAQQDPLAAGRALGVEFVLAGTVRKAAGRLRATVQLVSVLDGVVVWADEFELTCSNVFALESSIANRVAREMLPALARPAKGGRVRYYTRNTAAYQAYLKGRYYYSRKTAEGFFKSVENFRQAVEIDPDYALAYAATADAYLSAITYCLFRPTEIALWAKKAVAKALELDDALAEAHAARAG